MSIPRYILTLKSRQVELKVLRGLKEELKKDITPLIELAPALLDAKKRNSKKKMWQHLDALAYDIARSWVSNSLFENGLGPIFIDGVYLDNIDNLCGDNVWPTMYVIDILQKYGIRAIPVMGLEKPLKFYDDLSPLIANNHGELCLRVPLSTFESKDYFNEKFSLLTSRVTNDLKKYNFILDLGALSFEGEGENFQDLLDRVINCVGNSSLLSKFNAFSIIGTSFPKSFSNMDENSWLTLPRYEFMIWKRLMRYKKELHVEPGFGDHGIESQVLNVTSGASKLPAYLRYSREDDVVILKGRDIGEYGKKQFWNICQKIVNSEYFNGEDYSWGDYCLFEMACKRKRIGNPKIWKEIGFNHHIKLTIDQIQNFTIKRTDLEAKTVQEIGNII